MPRPLVLSGLTEAVQSQTARCELKEGFCHSALEWDRQSLQARFYIDPATGAPHIYSHHVDEDEVVEVLEQPGEDRAAREGSRIALGQTASGRYLRVIYVPDNDPESVFVIAAFDLTGKPLAAYHRRRSRKHQ